VAFRDAVRRWRRAHGHLWSEGQRNRVLCDQADAFRGHLRPVIRSACAVSGNSEVFADTKKSASTTKTIRRYRLLVSVAKQVLSETLRPVCR
jgi:hypothetical protein